MMQKSATTKRVLSSILSSIVALVLVLAPVSETLRVQRAEAQWAVFDAANTIQSTISAASDIIQEGFQYALNLKEFSLDAIAWGLVNVMAKEMIKSMTQWVNNGFEGNPAFVTDFEGFMRDIADDVAGNFIWGNKDLRFLCSPFALDIKLALDTQYRESRNYKAQCTLSDVVGNMNNFLSGDFLEGGWDGWYSLTQNPKNNPYGALLDAQYALSVKIGNQQIFNDKIAGWGKGFLSQTQDVCVTDVDTGTESCRKVTVTPGTVIENQLNTTLGIPAGRLTIADELNELIGALFSQLVSTIFSSASGLLGSTNSSGSGGSIFDDIGDEPDPSDPSFGMSLFDSVVDKENRFLALITEAYDLLTGASLYWENTYADDDRNPRTPAEERCYDAGVTNFPPALEQMLSEATTEFTRTGQMLTDLEVLRADLLVLNDADSPAEVIAALLTKYNASTVAGARQNLMKQFDDYRSSLHTTGEIGLYEARTLPGIREAVSNFIQSVDQACGGGGDVGGN